MTQATIGVPPVPYNTPISDKTGFLSYAWVAWFRQVLSRIGGTYAGDSTTYFLRADGVFAAPPGAAYSFSDSLVEDGGDVTLAGDESDPADTNYYGTNSEGARGYYAFPTFNQDTTGSAGSLTQTLDDNAVVLGAGTGVQSLGTLGSTGQVLTSQGAGEPPIWQASSGSGALVVTGTRTSPVFITASGGVTSGTNARALIRVAGSGGAVTITSDPEISAGYEDGQELFLEGCDSTDTLTINNGSGVEQNGPMTLGVGDKIYYLWNQEASVWTEVSRFYSGIENSPLTDDAGNPLTDDSGNELTS